MSTAGAALGAEESGLALGLGVNYSQGDYGTDTTTRISSIVLTARYETGRWTFRGTLPYLHLSGRGAVVPGVGRVRDTGILLTESKVSGFGDPVASATYAAYYDSALRFGLDATGRIKLAVGKVEEQLSTGEHDLGFQLDALPEAALRTG